MGLNYLLDFTKLKSLQIKLQTFIEDAGDKFYGSNYHGISRLAKRSIESLVGNMEGNDLKIYGIPDLKIYFSQMYILKGFLELQSLIKWHPKPQNEYLVDLTQVWDLEEIKFELKRLVKIILHGDSQVPENNLKGINQLLDPKLYGYSDGLVVRSPKDVEVLMPKYFVEVLTTYQNQIKWMDEDTIDVRVLEKEYLINFAIDHDLNTIRLQLDTFLLLAGKENCGCDYFLSNSILRETDRLLDKRFYGKTVEHIITGPDDLDVFYVQKYARRYFRKYRDQINWAKPLTKATRYLPYEYFYTPLRRPPMHRIANFINPMIQKETWKMAPLKRKEVLQEELYYHVSSIPSPIKSPIQVLPPVYARKQTSEGGASWWCSKSSYNASSSSFSLVSNDEPFPSWLSDKFKTIEYKGFDMGIKSFLHHGIHTRYPTASYLEAKFSVYCLVVYVIDFERFQSGRYSAPGGNSHAPSPYQVYIGRCINGVSDRWIDQPYSHCRVTKRLVNQMKGLLETGKPFKPYSKSATSVGTAQLPQVMIALAKAKSYPHAMFVLKSGENEAEMDEFEKEMTQATKAGDMRFGLNVA